MTDAPAIATQALVKHYGDVRAVEEVDLTVARGECFGLLGHNGAGKTTMIRMLTCRARPTSGTAAVLGHDIVDGRDALRPRINLVSDEQNLHPRLTGRQTLRFWADLYGVGRNRVDELLELVGLDAERTTPVKDWSTGMRQRIVIARALVNDPAVIFMDEPTRGLDPASARTLRGIARDLVARGTTVFLTTHDMAEADELCDRVAFMSEGRIVALDTPRALRLKHTDASDVRARVVLDDGSERDVHLADDAGRRELDQLLAGGRVRALHTNEPTLADVFVQLAGRPLDETDGGPA
jgi:ABC-2 type transport system ATP-binding protein